MTPNLPTFRVTYRPVLDRIIAIVGEPEGYDTPDDGEFSERQSKAMEDSLSDCNELLEGAHVIDSQVDF